MTDEPSTTSLPGEPHRPNINHYKGNSHKERDAGQKSERRKIEKVISGTVIQRKKSLGSRVAETFFAEDDLKTVVSGVFFDTIIPAIKSMIFEAGEQSLDRVLFGESGRRSRSRTSPYKSTGYTSYNRFHESSKKDAPGYRREAGSPNRSWRDFDNFILDDRGEAEGVLDGLRDLVDDYGSASVADLHDLLGKTPTDFTGDKWGWTDLRDGRIVRTRDGYLLDLPKTVALD